MFRFGIKPEWEDDVNKKGGEFKVEFSNLKDETLLNALWETLVFDLVTGKCPKVEEGIAGVRLVQKSKM